MNTAILWSIVGMAAALVVDQVLGAIVAFKEGRFSFSELPTTLKNNVLPFLLPLGLLGIMASLDNPAAAGFVGIYTTFAAGYSAKLFADIAEKIKIIYGI